jgi:cytochrome P450
VTDKTIRFDPFSPEFRRDPYPYYDALRAEAPVYPFMRGGQVLWLITRYDDCDASMRSRTFVRELGKILAPGEMPPRMRYPEAVMPLVRLQKRWMLFLDPPDHSRLRKLVGLAFTPRRAELLRNSIETITNKLVDEAKRRGRMDVIADLALPLPVSVISELLGIEDEDRDVFREQAEYMLGINDLVPPAPETMAKAGEAARYYESFFRRMIETRRREPGDDLISGLIQARDAGDRLSEEELVATSVLLLGAGFESTTNFIGNGVLALLRHPGQFRLLQSDPALARNAVEELLRFDAPVQMTTRRAAEDVELRGERIRRGQSVAMMLGAANRDPARYAEPHRLDIQRADVKPLSFGGGIHFCLGTPLARLEGEIAFRTLASRLPDMKLASDPDRLVYRDMIAMRGLMSLPVSFG